MKALRALCIALTMLVLAVPALADDCITGTVSAVETPSGSGTWKYCITFTYDVTSLGNSPSHFSLLVGALANCPCICDAIWFDTPAGSSTGSGESGPCVVEYNGRVRLQWRPDAARRHGSDHEVGSAGRSDLRAGSHRLG